MKTKVKTTGEIVEIVKFEDNLSIPTTFNEDELEFNPDYWERLKHQAAISAMQGIMANSLFMPYDGKEIAELSDTIATAIVEKLKEK